MRIRIEAAFAAAIPEALEKAHRYRLLNEPWQAESICHDVLQDRSPQPDCADYAAARNHRSVRSCRSRRRARARCCPPLMANTNAPTMPASSRSGRSREHGSGRLPGRNFKAYESLPMPCAVMKGGSAAPCGQ